MEKHPGKRRGRPPLSEGEGKRHAFSVRTTKETRKRLEDAARQSGRSIAQEAELRLEQSFNNEAGLGGREMVGLFRMMAGAAAIVEERQNRGSWSTDWETFVAVREVWRNIIDHTMPVADEGWQKDIETVLNSDPGDPPEKPDFFLTRGSDASHVLDEQQQVAVHNWVYSTAEWEEKARKYILAANNVTRNIARLTRLGSDAFSDLVRRVPSKPAVQNIKTG